MTAVEMYTVEMADTYSLT